MKSTGWVLVALVVSTLLWLATLPVLTPHHELIYAYPPLQSGVLRFYANDHINAITVNGSDVPLPPWYAFAQGEKKLITLDLSPWLPAGGQPVAIGCTTQNDKACEIKSVHSTATMLLILFIFCATALPAYMSIMAGPDKRLLFRHPRAGGDLLFQQVAEVRQDPRLRGDDENYEHTTTLPAYSAQRLKQWLHSHEPQCLLVIFLSAIAFCLHTQFIEFESYDYGHFLRYWTEHIQRRGLSAYHDNFTNYAPLYTYFLGLFDLFFPTMNTLYQVKLVTFIGEILAASWAYRLLRLHAPTDSLSPTLAAMLVLLCPSVLADGASAAQCDIWYTGFLFGMVYYMIQNRPRWALIYCGLAFSFKLQTTFMAPLLLTCLLQRRIAWTSLWIVPMIYLCTCLPSWLEGRKLTDLLDIYLQQAGGSYLSANAPNFYYLLEAYNHHWIVPTGIAAAMLATILIARASYKTWNPTVENTVLLAALCGGLIPFLLPKMHDRYFFMADLFSLLLCCIRPRWCFICICFQLASVLAYPPEQLAITADNLAWSRETCLFIGMCLNLIAISGLLVLCYRAFWSRRP